MTEPKTTKPKKAVREKMRRPVKPNTLLIHILEYTRDNEISANDPIQTMIDSLRDAIVADSLGQVG